MRPRLIPLVLFAVLLLTGCGGRPTLVPVTGAVTFHGKPLTAGSIWFHPAEGSSYQGEKPSCLLGLDGSFTMRTYPHGNGVPPGTYKVTLAPELANRISRPQYADPAKTPWSVTVPPAGLSGQAFEVQ
ncbi:MAG: hypothetical protein U0736_20885 [Gemmataceae bacterium]